MKQTLEQRRFLLTNWETTNDEKINPPETHNNPKCGPNKQQSLKIHKETSDRAERKRDKSTITIQDLNIFLSTTDRVAKQKTAKTQNNTINQQDLIDTYGAPHPTKAEYTVSSQVPMEYSLRRTISWATIQMSKNQNHTECVL